MVVAIIVAASVWKKIYASAIDSKYTLFRAKMDKLRIHILLCVIKQSAIDNERNQKHSYQRCSL